MDPVEGRRTRAAVTVQGGWAAKEHPDELLARGSREHYDDAVYYDHAYRSRREDIRYYVQTAQRYGSPVLELGVGTGRVAVPLAAAGHKVVGIDASEAMLARARERGRTEALPRGSLTLRDGDLADFSLRRKFPLIIAPFNALLHLYEPETIGRCFACVARHLAPGGRFVFDIRVPSVRELSRDPTRAYVCRPFVHPTLGPVGYTETFQYDPIKQVQYVRMRFTPRGPLRGRAKPREVLLTQRQIFPAELRGLLSLGGLRLTGRYGDFTGRPLAPDDPLEIVVARQKSDLG